MSIVNNITRFLDARKIPYTAYETPAEKLSALEVAHLLDVQPDSVFKTIVVTPPPMLTSTPAPATVVGKYL